MALVASVSSAACTSTATSATAPSSGKCQVSANATPLQFTASGGSGTLNIGASRDCTWTITPPATWVSLNGSQTGNGDASLAFTVASNPLPAQRASEIVVETQHLALTQAAAPCTFSLSRSGDSVPAAGGTVGFTVTTLAGCSWTAMTGTDWISLPGTRSGSATAAVSVQAAANSGPARTGSVAVAGQSYTVSQDAATTPGAPAPSPTPPPPSPSPTPTPLPITFAGTVSARSGSCPTLHFQAGGFSVSTDRTTSYSHGKCGDLSNGDTVKVTGLVQTDGSVAADQIEITTNDK